MSIPPLDVDGPKERTLTEYVYDELHRIFTRAAEVMAENESDPEVAAGIPAQFFRAENWMRNSWDTFVEKQEEAT